MPDAPQTQADQIYVGYLPTPARHRALLRVALPALALLAALLGGGIAALQRDPGPAVWGSEIETVSGPLVAEPYPIIFDPELGPVLLVVPGKQGIPDVPTNADGSSAAGASASGTLLQRDGVSMMEVSGPLEAVANAGPPPAATTPVELELVGEIVDSKCNLGAMKPGEGKTHRACATLCIRGGIPPIIVSRGDDGGAVYTLVTTADGGPANEMVIERVGDVVRVGGELVIRGPVRSIAASRLE